MMPKNCFFPVIKDIEWFMHRCCTTHCCYWMNFEIKKNENDLCSWWFQSCFTEKIMWCMFQNSFFAVSRYIESYRQQLIKSRHLYFHVNCRWHIFRKKYVWLVSCGMQSLWKFTSISFYQLFYLCVWFWCHLIDQSE